MQNESYQKEMKIILGILVKLGVEIPERIDKDTAILLLEQVVTEDEIGVKFTPDEARYLTVLGYEVDVVGAGRRGQSKRGRNNFASTASRTQDGKIKVTHVIRDIFYDEVCREPGKIKDMVDRVYARVPKGLKTNRGTVRAQIGRCVRKEVDVERFAKLQKSKSKILSFGGEKE